MKYIKGEIYNVNSKADDNFNIFMWGDDDSSCYIQVKDKYFEKKGGGNFPPTCTTTIEASLLEKKWLLACKELGKYIPLKDIKEIQSYEVY